MTGRGYTLHTLIKIDYSISLHEQHLAMTSDGRNEGRERESLHF